MKTMKYFLSMAALALVGAMTVSCSSDNDITDQPQQPENKSNLVTLTTTVGLDGGATTRALTADGVKTFAVDDQIAVIYTKNGGTVTKAVSKKLISTDIASGSKSATFTVTLDDPDKTVIEPLADLVTDKAPLYDFDLMQGGGHVTGAQMFTRFTSVPVFLAVRLGNVMAL